MDAASFRSLLRAGPLLTDGGMGTSLIDRGAPVDACFEALNVSDPTLVEAVHRAFVEAGARLVIANTFGGNRFRLDRHGNADRVASYDHAAVVLARRAGAGYVAGSMGPLGVRLAPYGRVSPSDAFDAYREHAGALVDAGVDVIMIETQTDLREMEQALAAAREAAPDLAVVVSATFTKDDRTLLGSTPEQVAARLVDLGTDAIGVNCGEGPAQVLRVVRAMTPHAGGLPIVARPNAGGPAEVGGRFVYPATPDYVGELAHALLDEGVEMIGGCCGTGPAHTAAIAEALAERRTRMTEGSEAHPGGAPITVRDAEAVAPPGPLGGPDATTVLADPARASTMLQRKLATGAFVIAVEMEPPRSFNAATLVAAAGTLRDAGADVIDVADSPMAKMRMSAWAACRLVQEHVGIETVLHFPTRGRNLLRLQGDLLGAHALGIRNLFVCVGDPVTIGDYPHGSNNVDVTATGLLALINDDFNEGRDRAGSSIGEPTAFFVGAAVSPNAADPSHEVRLLKRKIDAGASFFLTQPVYEPEALQGLKEVFERIHDEPLAVPFLVGVLPLVTSRHAEFLHNEVPGIRIPDVARERMRKAGDKAWKEGLAMAADLVDGLRTAGAAGIYVMPQFGRYDLAAEVVEVARA
ncbi:MAG: bifunctional homocysteine S-methyltransferase/methylenetetrahydrofolate reductase [Actinomycetota bacterium]|nr:bifunctional homocysteine S-methyltransferase/methylenetetrahydrofolate reductase [Actinomycetota bacterium]